MRTCIQLRILACICLEMHESSTYEQYPEVFTCYFSSPNLIRDKTSIKSIITPSRVAKSKYIYIVCFCTVKCPNFRPNIFMRFSGINMTEVFNPQYNVTRYEREKKFKHDNSNLITQVTYLSMIRFPYIVFALSILSFALKIISQLSSW